MKTITYSEVNYLLAIYELSMWMSGARITDIAEVLNVTKPSACRAVRNLTDKGYISRNPNREVALTDRGMALAEEVFYNRSVIRQFLIEGLGVDEQTADTDAPLLEYCVGVQTFHVVERIVAPKGDLLALESV